MLKEKQISSFGKKFDYASQFRGKEKNIREFSGIL